jgi:hypothetical protein
MVDFFNTFKIEHCITLSIKNYIKTDYSKYEIFIEKKFF